MTILNKFLLAICLSIISSSSICVAASPAPTVETIAVLPCGCGEPLTIMTFIANTPPYSFSRNTLSDILPRLSRRKELFLLSHKFLAIENSRVFYCRELQPCHLMISRAMYLPVMLSLAAATFSGVPQATMRPPFSPPSGPISIM